MTFDEKIVQSLQENTQWRGSPDLLWKEVQSQLPKQTPWWKRQRLWFGTAVAATMFMVFLIQSVLTPPPPVPGEPEIEPQMRSFAVSFIAEEPLIVIPKSEVSLPFDLVVEEGPEVFHSPTLMIMELGEGSGVFFQEIALSNEELALQSLTVLAPDQPGSYRVAIQGTIVQGEQVYTLHGEREILVQEEKGR